MAIINELGDSDYFQPATQQMNVGDTFAGTSAVGDFGDKVSTVLSVGTTYTMILEGRPTDADYSMVLIGPSGRVFHFNATYNSDDQGAVTATEVSDNRYAVTFVAPATGPYELQNARGSFAGGEITYQMSIIEGGIPPEADPINEITGTADKDTLTGTDGADLANLDDGDDRFLAGEGNDIVNGGDGKDRLAGNAGDDTMDGGAGDDQMHGGSGADELIGGAGRDKLIGGGGNDVITGGAGNDHLRGNAGDDTMDGGNNNDRLFGGDGNDVMTAGQGNDKMWGEDGNDNMSGGVGHDVVKGGAGNDTIDGGAGRDKLEGGADADVFVFGPGAGRDIIVDFEDGVDQIDLSAYGFTDITDLTFVSMGDAVRVYTDGADSFLMRDTDVADLGNDDFIWA